MDAKQILEELFTNSKVAAKKGVSLAEQSLGVPESGPERDQMLSGMTKGALAAGAVALLLGTKGGRSLTGTAVKLGGLAAVGGLAYKAYNQWQDQQTDKVTDTGTPIGELEEAPANQRSMLLVRAMISAARADGSIDASERVAIEQQIDNFGLDSDTANFLMAEINQPLDVVTLASKSESPEESAEIYLASAMVIDTDQTAERAYLDSLADALNLDPGLAKSIEYQLQQA